MKIRNLIGGALLACSLFTVPVVADEIDLNPIAEKVGVDAEVLHDLHERPLYTFSEAEVNSYLKALPHIEPDLRKRIQHLARKNIGQPYELYLLGEFPFETYDSQPLYCLDRSDCVVFSEHTYAMALSDDWTSFFTMLQRIRYKNGQIGVATRNHYTEADWNINNSWLIEDITKELLGDEAGEYPLTVNRARFLKNRYEIESDVPVEKLTVSYVPADKIMGIADQLQAGDFVNVVRGRNGGKWVGHVGLITVSEDGTRHMLHSTPPNVIEQTLEEYVSSSVSRNETRKAEGKTEFMGLKFLRLREDALENLRELDGPEAPVISAPNGSRLGG